MEEVKEITTVDGFVAVCFEIKESMFFYERDLMLAAFSASLELLAVVVMLGAALKGEAELQEAYAELQSLVDGLFIDLNKFQFFLDVQYVVDNFLQGAGL